MTKVLGPSPAKFTTSSSSSLLALHLFNEQPFFDSSSSLCYLGSAELTTLGIAFHQICRSLIRFSAVYRIVQLIRSDATPIALHLNTNYHRDYCYFVYTVGLRPSATSNSHRQKSSRHRKRPSRDLCRNNMHPSALSIVSHQCH